MAGSINYTKLLAKLDPQPGGEDTALSGSLIGSYQIYQATTGQLYVPQDSFYVKAAADVTHDIHLSLTHSAGTATPSGAADTVRYLEVYEVGLYGDYTNAEDV